MTEDVLVSEFVSQDSFSDSGTPSQGLELVKKRFRNILDMAAVDYIRGKAKRESRHLIKIVSPSSQT